MSGIHHVNHVGSYDNLVVGCPLCSEEQGTVYYYGNNNGHLTPVRIPAPNNHHKGHFGMSIESIGDLDRDGYNGNTRMIRDVVTIELLS